MGKKFSGVSQTMSRFRGWIQAGATLLTNLHLPNFLKGGLYQGTGKTVCVPGLNCYSCPGAVASCPLGALQALLKQYPERSREISVLLSPIDESREQERKNREEFESLAQAVKTAFYNALQDGKQEEAQEILSRYQQLNGDDPELAMMRIMMVQPQGGALS